MEEAEFLHWQSCRQISRKGDPLWPYLVWRYEQEHTLKVLANEWAFPVQYFGWAAAQMDLGNKPWAKRKESADHRRSVVVQMSDYRAKKMEQKGQPND